MSSLKSEGVQEIIHLDEWAARSYGDKRWKVTVRDGNFTFREMGSMR